jgi:hypothetical protein
VKVVIYEAFVEGKLEAPKHLARTVHDLYFEPKYEEFRPRTIWSLSNAFTSALKPAIGGQHSPSIDSFIRVAQPYNALKAVIEVFRSAELTLGNIVPGVFTPVLAKHSKSFNLIDTLAVGVDRIQRNFEPMQRQVEHWRQAQITDERAKLILYAAFVDGKLDAPRSLLPEVHRLYFEPQYEEFSGRTMWSLSNAFTSAFKRLDPVPQFKATAKLGEFLNQLPA